MRLPHRLCPHWYHYLQPLMWTQKNTHHLSAYFESWTNWIHNTNTKMGKCTWFGAIGTSSSSFLCYFRYRNYKRIGSFSTLFHFILLLFLACAILSVPIESDQCALVKAHTLSAFSLFQGKEPGRGGPPAASSPCCCGCWVLGRSLQEPRCLSPCCRKIKQRRSRGPAAVPLSPWGIVNVECGESFLRRTLEQYSQDQPIVHALFPKWAGPSSGLCPWDFELVPLSLGRKCGLLCACTLSVPASCGGGHLRTQLTTPLWQLSSHRKNIQGTGDLLLFADLGEPEVPGAAFVPTPV